MARPISNVQWTPVTGVPGSARASVSLLLTVLVDGQVGKTPGDKAKGSGYGYWSMVLLTDTTSAHDHKHGSIFIQFSYLPFTMVAQ